MGSTYVEGLAAKPKIDIIVEVEDLSFDYSGLLSLDYEFKGGFNLPLRKCFTLRSDVSVNLHVFEKGDPEVELNLLFRDYLRAHDDIRDEYAKLKYKLVAKKSSHIKDGMMYRGDTLGKHYFISGVLREVGFDKLRFVLCVHHKEWDTVRRYCKKHLKDRPNSR